MSVATALDGICRYFGGPYDPDTRTYRASPVAGVGVVRRAFPKRDDHADYFRGMELGTRTGCQIVATIYRQQEFRIALGGEHGGWKQRNFDVELACFIRSRTSHAEDAQDDVYDLQDALLEWMRLDRTLGGAVFQAGEHMTNGSNVIGISYGQPETKAELTKSFMSITFSACELIPNA
ncbi:hypothetical protein [Streptomyces sp. NPDC006739]|uniref:hypothetical protein n=1 Tax=Streptomyces sp. NPDC006739 TaxID=3364763 RepID=UPI0036CAAB62